MTVHKHIEVFTNDPTYPRIALDITGKVLNFARVDPAYARLVGRVGSTIEKTVTITREKAFPFKIIRANPRNGTNIAVNIHEFNQSGKSGYTLTIENKKKNSGRYADAVILTTDRKIKPMIVVPVYGQIIAAAPPSTPSGSGKTTQGG
jgi:hypothetical protein